MVKRIVFTVSNDLKSDQRMIRICNSLNNAGYQVEIIGFKKSNSLPTSPRPYLQTRQSLIFQNGKLFYLEISIRLFFKLFINKSDIICAVDMDTLLPAFLVSKLRGKILVFDAHEYYSETSGLVGRSFEKSIWQKLERWLIPKMENAYTVNNSLADIFQKEFGVSFQTIMNAPVLDKNVPDEHLTSDLFYLYQGVLNKGRGLMESVEVFKNNDLQLKIAGDGPLFPELREFIVNHNLSDRIELLGWKTPEDLQKLTQKAFIGLNLIDGTGKSYFYSLANKFFDYMHAGIPQISMNFPEYTRINNDFKIAFLIDDFSELESVIAQIQSDPLILKEMRENCILAKQHYHWGSEEKKLLQFYARLA